MSDLIYILHHLEEFPDYIPAAQAALAVLIVAVPIYAGLWYFLYRRQKTLPWRLSFAILGVFVLFAGLSFLFASPLSNRVYPALINAYLFITCLMAAYCIVALLDIFVVQHYLIDVRHLYISPPLHKVINFSVFCMAVLPILRFVLKFNPFTLVAIPTIATAGIALAFQDTLKTFIAGIGLGNLIRVGQWIAFQDKEGQVVDINWGRTVLRTMDGDLLYIPNTLLLTQPFFNFSANRAHRMTFKVGLAYSAPPSRVKQILQRCAQNLPGAAEYPEPIVEVLNYTDATIIYALFYWIEDYSQRLEMQDRLATRVWDAVRHEGFELPTPFPSHPIQPVTQAEAPPQEILKALQQWEWAPHFSVQDLNDLAQASEIRSFLPSEYIVRQGDPGDSLFIILQGSVEVLESSASKPLAVLGKNQIFGEMSLLTGSVRQASVRAQSVDEVLEIKKAGLQKVLTRNPALADHLGQLLSERQAVLATHQKGTDRADEARLQDRSLTQRIRKFFNL
jgi:small-conductance mechanosensitive channel/CRP-like cAMP-binding protein